jgi:hypothetical protein
MKEELREGGIMALVPAGPGVSGIYRSRLDLLSLETGERIAQLVVPDHFWDFAGHRMLFSHEYTIEGVPIMGLWRIVLQS